MTYRFGPIKKKPVKFYELRIMETTESREILS